MHKRLKIATSGLALAVLTASAGIAFAGDHANYCMDVEIKPFHMMPDPTMDFENKTCEVPQYLDGDLQESFFAFTKEDHLFNCEYFGPVTQLPLAITDPPTMIPVPSAVVSQDKIVGTIGGHKFEAKLACASLTNWYQDSCADPHDPMTCSFQLAQPFISKGLPFPRVTEVSVFDGKITVGNDRHARKIPIIMATRAAGITHLENLKSDPPLVGASVTHSLLGMVTYKGHGKKDDDDRHLKVLEGSADLLLQGHIFAPVPLAEDPGAAQIKGSICSEDLYKQLNRKKKGHGHGDGHGGGHHGGEHHDDD